MVICLLSLVKFLFARMYVWIQNGLQFVAALPIDSVQIYICHTFDELGCVFEVAALSCKQLACILQSTATLVWLNFNAFHMICIEDISWICKINATQTSKLARFL